MIEYKDEPLSSYTTFRIGGRARFLLQPENEEELIGLIADYRSKKTAYRVIGNGSNLLISDRGIPEPVINNQAACLRLEIVDGVVYAGSSVKLQSFIRFCVRNGVAAYEYLFSVPATIGGAIFMNAGRGKSMNQQISDYLVGVRVFDGKKVYEVSKNECDFGYRKSIFHSRRDLMILGAYFKPPAQLTQIGEQNIKERMRYVKETQDFNHRTAGSVFKSARHGIFYWVKGVKIGDAQYSDKTTNWINNNGSATADDVRWLIRIVFALNLLTFKVAQQEIEYWG